MRSSCNWRLVSMTVATRVLKAAMTTPPQAGDRKEGALKMLTTGMPQLEWAWCDFARDSGARSKPPRCVRPVLIEMQGFFL
jgi:hypothetical protein